MTIIYEKVTFLICILQSSHSSHNVQHIVLHRHHVQIVLRHIIGCFGLGGDLQLHLFDSGHIARTRGLHCSWAQCEAVGVHTIVLVPELVLVVLHVVVVVRGLDALELDAVEQQRAFDQDVWLSVGVVELGEA